MSALHPIRIHHPLSEPWHDSLRREFLSGRSPEYPKLLTFLDRDLRRYECLLSFADRISFAVERF